MKKFLFVISLFIGILSYNMFVPTKQEIMKGLGFGTRPDEMAAVSSIKNDRQLMGCFVALFFSGMSFFGLNALHTHLMKRK